MDIKRLTELAALDFANFIPNENNVKHKIVIPFLQCFDHRNVDLEHAAQGSRIDINIGNKIIVETKALSKQLDNHVQQLSDYCGREWPVLAILTNGKKFRIYSPKWRRQANFRETIIYTFDIEDLTNAQLLDRLEKILGFGNYQSMEFLDYIEEREKELLEVERKIDDLKQVQIKKISELKTVLIGMKEQLRELNNKIQLKEQAVAEMESQEIPEIDTLVSEFFVPRITEIPDIQKQNTVNRSNINEGNRRTKENPVSKQTMQRNTEQPRMRETTLRVVMNWQMVSKAQSSEIFENDRAVNIFLQALEKIAKQVGMAKFKELLNFKVNRGMLLAEERTKYHRRELLDFFVLTGNATTEKRDILLDVAKKFNMPSGFLSVDIVD